MAHLFSSLTISKNTTLKNRIVLPPMCMYQAGNDGIPTKFHEIHYGARALGGSGLLIVEATAVESRGRISPNDLGLWSDSQIEGHAKMVEIGHHFDTKIVVQLAHAGRKSTVIDEPIVGASPIAFSDQYQVPHSLTIEEIQGVKKAFANAAVRAEKSGYDGIEIHAAHGYLISSFLSPLTNIRQDQYGGSFENRVHLLEEIIAEVKNTIKIPVGIRISATEWMTGGWNLEDSIALSKRIQNSVDYIHVSAGGNAAKPDLMPDFKPLYQVDYAQAIKKAVHIPVIAVGLITTVEEAAALVNEEKCDLVALGREMLRNPNFPQLAAQKLGKNESVNSSYVRAF